MLEPWVSRLSKLSRLSQRELTIAFRRGITSDVGSSVAVTLEGQLRLAFGWFEDSPESSSREIILSIKAAAYSHLGVLLRERKPHGQTA